MGLHCWTSNITIIFIIFVFINPAHTTTVMAMVIVIVDG
jgi:hypothetical protein